MSDPQIINDIAPGRRFRERFRRLADEWKDRSRYLSNTARMATLPSYQRISGRVLLAP